mmetsp:Transcript_6266/g.14750  ORF Transcript_6266/g.14750 Transcript_6266/m.14750 type:complete len:142 (+) Transcript_6266:53-478(+)|eukprot:690693-Rhodomonas_salina.2
MNSYLNIILLFVAVSFVPVEAFRQGVGLANSGMVKPTPWIERERPTALKLDPFALNVEVNSARCLRSPANVEQGLRKAKQMRCSTSFTSGLDSYMHMDAAVGQKYQPAHCTSAPDLDYRGNSASDQEYTRVQTSLFPHMAF